jgi:hypothetical protein
MDTILSGGTFDITRWGADTLPASQNHRAGAVDGSRSPRPDRQPALPRYPAGDNCHGKTSPAPIWPERTKPRDLSGWGTRHEHYTTLSTNSGGVVVTQSTAVLNKK